MRLYHFTCLLHLPEMMQEGITMGEVPTGPIPYNKRPNAANLTSDPDPNHQSVWDDGVTIDKTRIRITVEVPADSLTSFRQVKERYRIKSSWLKKIDPGYQRPHWYFAFGGVLPEQFIAVEIREGGTYRALSGNELKSLAANIEEERNTKLEILTLTDGARGFRFRTGFTESWLLDGRKAG